MAGKKHDAEKGSSLRVDVNHGEGMNSRLLEETAFIHSFKLFAAGTEPGLRMSDKNHLFYSKTSGFVPLLVIGYSKARFEARTLDRKDPTKPTWCTLKAARRKWDAGAGAFCDLV